MAMKSDLTLQDNTLYHGDCLGIMEAWVKTYPGGCVDLIYLDPPFNSNANYNILYGKDQKGKPRDEQAQFIAFNDTWYWGSEAAERVKNIGNAVAHPAYKAMRGLLEMLPEGGMLAYLSYMAERLAVMRDLLKENGSIYLHCDPTASHYLKAVMDCIFGAGNFRNELVWGYRGMGNRQAAKFQSRHDVILFYVKGKPTFNFQYGDPTPGSIKTYESAERVGYLANHRRKLVTVFDWDKYRAAVESGKLPKGMKEKEFDGGKPLIADWWEDIKILGGPNNKERLGYPTQKPLALLERIVAASSNEGDLVLDPFCGCGTTAEAAWKHGRKFIGIDISPYAITRVCHDRLKNAAGVSIKGLPTDLQSARDLLATKDGAFVFEHWAISLLEGYAPNDKQTGDGGIDGRGRLLNPPLDDNGEPENGLCIAQVKGGKITADSLRAFLSQITGGAFSMGVFITLQKQKPTPTMREVVGKAGKLTPHGDAKTYDRIVFWSIEEHFAGTEPKLPAMTHPFTGKALHPQIPTG